MNELAVLALLISLIFTELTNLLPGGIIVPFYFALYLDDPVKILATVISALIAMMVVKFLSRYTILYGRRKFALYLIIGILEKILFTYLYFGNSYMFCTRRMTSVTAVRAPRVLRTPCFSISRPRMPGTR